MTISAFGATAQRYAVSLSCQIPAVIADVSGSVIALSESVARLRRGESFLVAPLVDEPRALTAQRLSGKWIGELRSLNDRYVAFDALANERYAEAGMTFEASDLLPIDEPRRRVLRDVAMMSDTLLVRSTRDVERISRILGRRRPAFVVLPGRDPSVPPIATGLRKHIAVWAPYAPATALGVIAMALDCLKKPVVYVCAEGALAGVRGDFVNLADAPEVLREAACVVDASTADPASTIALAALGLPVASATTTGAAEFVNGLLSYDAWDWRTIFAAVSAALGARPPTLKASSRPRGELEAALMRMQPPRPEREPLVSILVLTYNRRELLGTVLDSLARQTYGNLDVLVVNNGGVNVADVVARHPFARLANLPENIPPNAAVDRHLRDLPGEYFGFTSDDDEFFPEHVTRLVAALEADGGQVAHSNTITRYIDTKGGQRKTVAYRLRADRPSDPLQILVGTTMSINSVLFRRTILDEIGGLATELAPADLEYLLRVSQRYDFVHVDSVTCEFNYILEGTSYTHSDKFAEDLSIIYERYPSNGSAIVERRREAEFARFAARGVGAPLWPPDLMLPE